MCGGGGLCLHVEYKYMWVSCVCMWVCLVPDNHRWMLVKLDLLQGVIVTAKVCVRERGETCVHTIYLWMCLPVAIDTDVLTGNACETGRYLDPIAIFNSYSVYSKASMCVEGTLYVCMLFTNVMLVPAAPGMTVHIVSEYMPNGIVLKYQPVG